MPNSYRRERLPDAVAHVPSTELIILYTPVMRSLFNERYDEPNALPAALFAIMMINSRLAVKCEAFLNTDNAYPRVFTPAASAIRIFAVFHYLRFPLTKCVRGIHSAATRQ